jgi:ADP-ribose pyrophosphatase YjhB (NUDIX family)
MTQTQEDLEKIEAYRKRLGKYPKPSITADVIAVRPSYSEHGEGQWRKNPEFALEVLFIKRGQWPFEGCWALPGGFIHPTETVEDGARRELREETSLESEHLIPIGVFSKPGRDMRAWVISNAFVSILKQDQGSKVKGGDDAATAKWLLLKSPTIEHGRFSLPFHDNGKLAFSLSGSYCEDELNGGTVLSVEDNPLAFDHAQIIAQAFLRLKSFDTKKLVFALLPEKFTLSNYIDVYQYLTHNSVCASNIPSFRRQLTSTKHPLLEVCEDEWDRTHLPAKLYRRKLNP